MPTRFCRRVYQVDISLCTPSQLFLSIDRIIAEQCAQNANISPSITRSGGCQGLLFQWELGAPYLTSPFAAHDPSCGVAPGYTLLTFNSDSSIIHVRSPSCSGYSSQGFSACKLCREVRNLVLAVQERAQKPSQLLQHAFPSHRQAQQHLQDKVLEVETSNADRMFLIFCTDVFLTTLLVSQLRPSSRYKHRLVVLLFDVTSALRVVFKWNFGLHGAGGCDDIGGFRAIQVSFLSFL